MADTRELGGVEDIFLEGLDLPALGRTLSASMTRFRTWQHRRVESLSFHGAREVRRRISVDFTAYDYLPRVGFDGSQALVPLAFLKKRPTTALDVMDATGAAVPVLTTEQNGLVVLEALIAAAAPDLQAAGVDPPSVASELRPLLHGVVFGTSDEAVDAFIKLNDTTIDAAASGAPLGALSDTEFVRTIVAAFASSFLLIAVPSCPLGSRNVLKLAYTEPLANNAAGQPDEIEREIAPRIGRELPPEVNAPGWWERRKDALGVTPSTYVLGVPGTELSSSYHVEVHAPEGLRITDARLSSPTLPHAAQVEPSRAGHSEIHLHASRDTGPLASVRTNLRIARDGWLRSALLSCSAVAAVLTVAALRIPSVFQDARPTSLVALLFGASPDAGSPSTDVAALLLALVALLAAIAVRRPEHPLTSRATGHLRAVTMTVVALPVVEAIALSFWPRSATSLGWFWWGVAGAALALLGLLWLAYLGPRPLTSGAPGGGEEPGSNGEQVASNREVP